MAQKKILEQSAVEREKPNTKLVLVNWQPLLNKPNKQNVYEIAIHLINSTFLSSEKFLTLIEV